MRSIRSPVSAAAAPLLDGGVVFVPEFGTADAIGRWIIEGTQ